MDAKDIARAALEDAVFRAQDAGMTEDEIRAEVDYILENSEA
jgi:Xaa-Pro aminopeptidase